MRTWAVVASLLFLASVSSSSTYTVTTNADSGLYGTLRWAIQSANTHPGPDTICFAIPANQSHVIRPESPLPALTDAYTTVDGAAGHGNTAPNVLIDGRLAGATSGLMIKASRCTVRGLALAGFQRWLIVIGGGGTGVGGCRLGVTLNGTALMPGRGAVEIEADGNTIGGTSPADRNIILPGSEAAVYIGPHSGNVVIGNYIGLKPNGQEAYGTTGTGVRVRAWPSAAEDNRIGGTAPGSGNVFGGLLIAVSLGEATDTTIQGNLFGLAADGDTLLPLHWGVASHSATGTQIGGTTPGARNVFAGGVEAVGVSIYPAQSAAPSHATIQGNYFGSNQAGTETRSLGWWAVDVAGVATSATIGGSTAAAGNYFTPTGNIGIGVDVDQSPGPVVIRNNKFGRLPAGGDVSGLFRGVRVQTGSKATIRDNTFTGWFEGVYARDNVSQAYGTEVWVFDNLFRDCTRAVAISGVATGHLGNLGNASTNDDGGNVFKPSNEWCIFNPGHNDLRAEGNDFSTTVISEIEGRIYDQLECPSAGRVDYVPFVGGPASAGAGRLAVTGAAATGGHAGAAEVTFSLSAPAEVTVSILNVAGRTVRRLCAAKAFGAGTSRLVWDGRTDSGTRAPAGTYLVSISARSADGQTSRGMATLRR
jgi:FlgD Ig-like domain